MENVLILISLLVLFQFLGRSADLVVLNIRKICHKLGVKVFFLGLILGFFTSLPEMAVGINSILKDLPEIPLGNLLGGIMVLFGLILGVSLIAERKVTTDGKISNFLPILIYITLPFILGLDSNISSNDGLIIVLAYILLGYLLYLQNRDGEHLDKVKFSRRKLFKKFGLILLGVILLAIISNLIIQLTLLLVENLNLPLFVVSVLIFTVGTNLPEIIIAFESWRKHIKELSISVLIGSAIANPAVIGIFSIFKPFEFKADLPYYILMAFAMLVMAALLNFYRSNKTLTRREGIVLVSIYVLFLLTQTLVLVY